MTVTNMVLLSLSAADAGPSSSEAGEDCRSSLEASVHFGITDAGRDTPPCLTQKSTVWRNCEVLWEGV